MIIPGVIAKPGVVGLAKRTNKWINNGELAGKYGRTLYLPVDKRYGVMKKKELWGNRALLGNLLGETAYDMKQQGGETVQQEMSQEEQLMQLFQAFADVMQDDEFNTAEEVLMMFQELSPEEQERFIQQAIQIVQGAQQSADEEEYDEDEEYEVVDEEDEEYEVEDDEEEPMMQGGGNVLYVESKNDPRYKSYADSLYNYNTGVKLKNAVKNIKDLVTVRKGSPFDVALQKNIKSRKLNDNSSDPDSDPNIRNILSDFQKKGNKSILPNRYNSYMADTRNSVKDLVLARPFTDMLGLTEKRNTKSYILPEWEKPNQQVTVNPAKNQTNKVQYKKPQQPVQVVERLSLPPIERLDFKPFQEYQSRFNPLEIESETEYIPGAYQGYERVIGSEYGKNADGQYNEFIHKYAPGKTIFKSNIKQTGGKEVKTKQNNIWQTGPQKVDAKDALGATYRKIGENKFISNKNNQKYFYNDISKKFIPLKEKSINNVKNVVPTNDERILSTLGYMVNKYGNPTIRKKDYTRVSDFLTGSSSYNLDNAISLNAPDKAERRMLLEELAHSAQTKVTNKPRVIKELVTSMFDPYHKEGTIEHEAHSKISPKLRAEFYEIAGFPLESLPKTEKEKDFAKRRYSHFNKDYLLKQYADNPYLLEEEQSEYNTIKQTGGKTKLTNYPYMKGSRPALSTSNGKSIEVLDGRTISMDNIYDADSVIVKGNEGKTFYKSKLKKYVK